MIGLDFRGSISLCVRSDEHTKLVMLYASFLCDAINVFIIREIQG